MAQMGFFDLSDRYASLDAKKGPDLDRRATEAASSQAHPTHLAGRFYASRGWYCRPS